MTNSNLFVLAGLFLAAVVLGGVAYLRTGSTPPERTFPTPTHTGGGYRVGLTPVRSTRAGGTVALAPGSDSVSVDLELGGLTPGGNYNVHLHEGSCERGGGGGLMLESVQSSKQGSGSSRSLVAYEELNPTMDHLVMVHRPDQEDVLCANLPSVPRMRSSREQSDTSTRQPADRSP